jgi:gamma-butyrobetaine dioxygenase
MLSHSLQTAANVRHTGGDEALELAGLLHDIGHMLGQHTEAATEWGVPDHAQLGARWLQQWLPAEVVEPIRLHVAAKRYMVAVEPGYLAELSPASIATLEQQGGPMPADEAAVFGELPFADAAVLLRRCDDLGKQPDATPGSLDDYRALLGRLVPGTAAAEPGTRCPR